MLGVLQRHKEPKTVFSPGFILTQVCLCLSAPIISLVRCIFLFIISDLFYSLYVMNVFHVIIVSFVMLLSAKSVYDCYMNYILCNFAYESLYSWTERGVLQR